MKDEQIKHLMQERMTGRLTRRQLVGRLAALGLSLPAISAIVAACGGSSSSTATTAGGTSTSTSSGGSTASASSGAASPSASPKSSASASPAGSPSAGSGSSSGSASAGTTADAAATAAAAGNFKGKTLVVTAYGGAWEEFLRKDIIPDFEKATGAKIELSVGLSKDWMTKLRAAGKDNPPYDVVIANETYISTARIEGHFASLPDDKVPNLKDIHPNMKLQDNVGVFALISPVAVGWMTEKVTNAPSTWSWMDLKNYTGKLGIYNASNSACAQHIMMMAKILNNGDYKNWQPGFDWIKNNLKPNKQTDFSGDMEKLLTTFEVNVGLLDSPAWARLSQQGIKMNWASFKEGVLMFEQNTNVTTGSKVKDLAFAWVNYLLSQPVQAKFAQSFWYTPCNTKVQIGGDLAQWIPLKPADLGNIQKWDYVWLNGGPRDDMVNRWNREMTS